MTDTDLTACDREPIHIPGSIQPHGILLVFERGSLSAVQGAGDIEGRFGISDWVGRSAGALIGDRLAAQVARAADSAGPVGFIGQIRSRAGDAFDVSAHQTGDHICVEIEPAPEEPAPASAILGTLEGAGAAFERATSLRSLCGRAAVEFRRLTAYDRVLVYRFLDDGSGTVLGEDRDPSLPSFLNHRFPTTDIPVQARALYIRNRVRVIPDIAYTPAPLRPGFRDGGVLDMSDCVLRSVSPIHLQYMRNMEIGASASISIVKDGALWGLVACHNARPKLVPYDQRAACRTLAGVLGSQIKARDEAGAYRERIRMRGFQDEIVGRLTDDRPLDEALAQALPDLRRMLEADGAAMLSAGDVVTTGACPPEQTVREIAGWVAPKAAVETFATEELSTLFPPALAHREAGSGLMAVTVSLDEPLILLWFRAEQLEVVKWAGNPHKAVGQDPAALLTPRASFKAWSETVRGRAAGWSPAEIEVGGRLRRALLDARQARRLRDLNAQLTQTLADKDLLLAQKEVLLKEVNHRVQNSLTLVTGFLRLQGRASEDAALRASLDEAQRRIAAVALVHRRLYQADQVETVDLSRYLDELCGEMLDTMGAGWSEQISLDLAPVSVPTDRAVPLGLILTELVINANKYAYGGGPGPIDIALQQDRTEFRLIVSDRGRGKYGASQGFGSRMMAALVSQLSGALEYADNRPGLRAVLTAPILPQHGA